MMATPWKNPKHKYGAKPCYYDPELQPCEKGTPDAMYLNKIELEFAKRLALEIRAGTTHSWRRLGPKDSWDFNLRAKKTFWANSRAAWDFYIEPETRESYKRPYWVECKGYFKPEDLVKLKRALKLYPERPLCVYTDRYGLEPAQVAVDRETKKAKEKKYRRAGNEIKI